MYTRQEVSKQKQAFWTTFGQYMQPVLSADGVKTNWINYKTGMAGINFRMDADNSHAGIAIVLSHNDVVVQAAHYRQLVQLKRMLHEMLQEEWKWEQGVADEYGKVVSKVAKIADGVNISRSEDWPVLISFFKPRIVALDAFWNVAKYGFEL